jgi:RNA polymerase sigma-70 factor (ECF subfamily)
VEDFAELAERHRRELLAHCYRMLGSVHDAEDLVQDVLLRAWRSYDGLQDPASARAWLHRIATNACLTALATRRRRPLPSGLGAPSDDPGGPVAAAEPDAAWLEPLPDALVTPASDDPASVATARADLRLALVASLQLLPPRQRAVFILREVLAFRAAEVAGMLGTTTAAVKSQLQRARVRLGEAAPVADRIAEPTEPAARALLEQYIAAFQNADLAALERVLRRDAALEMVGTPTWFAGRTTCLAFIGRVFAAGGEWRMLPTAANGQPAAASYLRTDGGPFRGFGIAVLDVAADGIRRIVVYEDAGLLATFGFPASLPDVPQ